MTPYILITALWINRVLTPVTAEVFVDKAQCVAAITNKAEQYCVPQVKTLKQSENVK